MSKLFGWLPRRRWQRWLVLAAITGSLLFVLLVVLAITGVLLWQKPAVQQWVMVRLVRQQQRQPTRPPPTPRLAAEGKALLATNVAFAKSAAELFTQTNVWDVHFKFTSNQWKNLGPKIVPPVTGFFQRDGSVILRNPQASRNGLAGVLGLDLPWSEATLEFAGVNFRSVGARFKGNGTFVSSQAGYKRPYKVALNKYVKGQRLAGRTTLNFHNLVADASCVKDTLAYEFFRQAGIPAPRTAFARVRLTIDDSFTNRLLGLYLLVENPDADWAREQFGVDGIALFKPVTYELFKDLGEDWKSYEGIYDPKTPVSPKQSGRVFALAKLVTYGTDEEFAAHVRDFVDVDEFARFLACQVILSNYDGILSNGQNFLLYLDPRTEKFGFIPWDLDHCWGEFGFVGTREQRERASLWHPWVGENRFLERMLAAKPVLLRYRRELERIRTTLFIPERLGRRVDDLAPVVRPFIAEESSNRLSRFRREIAEPTSETNAAPGEPNGRRRGYQIKRFLAERAISVTQQLDGTAEGLVPTRRGDR